MKSIKLCLFLACVTTLLLSTFSHADKSVNVDRVRWKSSFLNWKDHPDYPEWKEAGIWTEYRKQTYVSRYWNPGINYARTLILILPGQQGMSGASGCSNCITGQGADWDKNWGKGDKTKQAYIRDNSLAGQLIDSGQFHAYDTFLGIVFNPNFNWENTASAKNKAENAFANWFLKHGKAANVERIILLGSSRGGTLAARLAKNILQRKEWSNIPVYLGLIDAVANDLQNELLTANQPTCVNPLNSHFYARKSDLAGYFSGLNKPQVRHIITGAPVILGVAVHSFCADNYSWYDQSWANLEHTEIGRCNSSEGTAYNTSFMDSGINQIYNWLISTL